MKTKLPAGLTDKGVEFFVTPEEQIHATFNGSIIPFNELPNEILDLIRDHMITNKTAIKALVDMGAVTDEDMLYHYIKCNFGGYDYTPDITEDGKIKTEYWDCGQRGNCKYEGKLCSGIKVKNGILSTREIEVIKLIAEGLLDKEIADKLNMSIHTVPSHKVNIYEKTELRTKPELAAFAVKHNII